MPSDDPCATCGTPTVEVHSRLGRACIPCLHAQVAAAERSMAMLVPDGTRITDLGLTDGGSTIRYAGEPPSFLRAAMDDAYEMRIQGYAQLTVNPPGSNIRLTPPDSATLTPVPAVQTPDAHTCYGEETCHPGCRAYRRTAWERLDLDVFEHAAE